MRPEDHPLYPYRHVLLMLWLMAFAFYHAAWTIHETAAFSLNGFDLAEQVGIHPAIRAESPPLRTSGLLRLPAPFIAFGVALTALLYMDIRKRWLWRVIALMIALRVIPPETALRSPGTISGNDYAIQLLSLTLLGVMLVLLTLPLPIRNWLKAQMDWLMPVLAGLTLLLPAMGYNRAARLLEELSLDIQPGGGIILYGLVMILIAGISLYGNKKHGLNRTVFSKSES